MYSPQKSSERSRTASRARDDDLSYLDRRARSHATVTNASRSANNSTTTAPSTIHYASSHQTATTRSATVRSPLDHLSATELQGARSAFPRVYEALLECEALLSNSIERYTAKEAELIRCISVGQELLDQLDQLKDRCAVLAAERDAARARLETEDQREKAAAQQQQQCAMELARVKKDLARTSTALRESQNTLDKLRHVAAEKHLMMDESIISTASAHTTQLENTVAELQAEVARYVVLQRQEREEHAQAQEELASMTRVERAKAAREAEREKAAIVAEASIELERAQRSLSRLQEELRVVRDSAGAGNQEALERRYARQVTELEATIAELRHELASEKDRVARAEEALACARLKGSEESRHTAMNTSTGSGATAELKAASMHMLANDCSKLREENASLRRKLGDAHSAAQDSLDAAHKEKLQLTKELGVLRGELLALQNGTVPDLQRANVKLQTRVQTLELEVTRGKKEIHEVEAATEAMEQEAVQLREQLTSVTEVNAELKRCVQEQSATLMQEREAIEALEATNTAQAQGLRTLRAENADLEHALTELRQQAQHIQLQLDTQAHAMREAQTQPLNAEVESARAALKLSQQSAKRAQIAHEAQLREVEQHLQQAHATRIAQLKEDVHAAEVETRKQKDACGTVQKECQQLRDTLNQAHDALMQERASEAQTLTRMQARMQSLEGDLVEQEGRRRQVETLMVSAAAASSQHWNSLSDALGQLSSTAGGVWGNAKRSSGETTLTDLERQLVDLLKKLVGGLQADVEKRCEGQAREWAKVRRDMLSLYDEDASNVTKTSASVSLGEGRARGGMASLKDGADDTADVNENSLAKLLTSYARGTRELLEAAADLAGRTVQLEEAKTARAAYDALSEQTRSLKETHTQLARQLAEVQEEKDSVYKSLQRLKGEKAEEACCLRQEVNEALKERTELESRIHELEHHLRLQKDSAAVQVREGQEAQTLLSDRIVQLSEEADTLKQKMKDSQKGMRLQEESHAAERKELDAMRRVNRALEARLKEIEDDRDPLRQQLHNLLSSER